MHPLLTHVPVPVLAINLDQDGERLAECRAAFDGVRDFRLERSAGVIPAMPETAQRFLTRGGSTQVGTLGTFLAHVRAWETVAALDGPALIVEDDVRPAGLGRLLSLELPRDMDVLHVNHRMADPNAVRGALAVVPAWTILRHKIALGAPKAAPGGDGYLLTPVGAGKLLQALTRDGFGGHVDWRLLRYGCDRGAVERVGAGSWLATHRPMRADKGAPAWNVVCSYRTTHPLVKLRGIGQSSRKSMSGIAQRTSPQRSGD